MDLSRRDLFKLGGTAAAALGLSQLKLLNAHALEGTTGVDVYAFICGILKTQTQYILKDTRVGVPYDVPVPFFLIRHGSSWVAYDSGNNAQVAVDPVKYWGEAVCKAYTPVMKPHEEFKIQIKKLGLKPEDLYAVIMSHGHLDHCGALEDVAGTDVPVYLQKNELEAIKKQLAKNDQAAYIPADFNKLDKCNVRTLDGIFDVHKVDALLCTQCEIVAPITGFPSMSIPIGSAEDRIPIGSYWIAKRYDEATLLRITYAVEKLLKVKCVPEILDQIQS